MERERYKKTGALKGEKEGRERKVSMYMYM